MFGADIRLRGILIGMLQRVDRANGRRPPRMMFD